MAEPNLMATVRGDRLWRCPECGYTTNDAGPDECVACESPLLLVESPRIARVVAGIPLEVTRGVQETGLVLPEHLRGERRETEVRVLHGLGPLWQACADGRLGPWIRAAPVRQALTRQPMPGETVQGRSIFYMLGGFESMNDALTWADHSGFSAVPFEGMRSFAGLDWDVRGVSSRGEEDWTQEGRVRERIRFGDVPPPGELPADHREEPS